VIDEAIVRGVPVVATPVGGIGEEFSGGEVLLVKEKDPDALSRGIEKMLFDDPTRVHHLQQAEKRGELLRRHDSAARQHLLILLDETGQKAADGGKDGVEWPFGRQNP
jgi:glycosyltransferase involved in cell wall biosynthesis